MKINKIENSQYSPEEMKVLRLEVIQDKLGSIIKEFNEVKKILNLVVPSSGALNIKISFINEDFNEIVNQVYDLKNQTKSDDLIAELKFFADDLNKFSKFIRTYNSHDALNVFVIREFQDNLGTISNYISRYLKEAGLTISDN